MKNAGVRMDLGSDTAEIFGKDVKLMNTSAGHYCLPLSDCCTNVESIHLTLIDKPFTEKRKQYISYIDNLHILISLA